ncbi:hypothetical protein A5881_003615 [Enterococcus termitis]
MNNLNQVMKEIAIKDENRLALVDGSVTYTYKEFYEISKEFLYGFKIIFKKELEYRFYYLIQQNK